MKMKNFNANDLKNHLSNRHYVYLNDRVYRKKDFKLIYDSISYLTTEFLIIKITGRTI